MNVCICHDTNIALPLTVFDWDDGNLPYFIYFGTLDFGMTFHKCFPGAVGLSNRFKSHGKILDEDLIPVTTRWWKEISAKKIDLLLLLLSVSVYTSSTTSFLFVLATKTIDKIENLSKNDVYNFFDKFSILLKKIILCESRRTINITDGPTTNRFYRRNGFVFELS